MSDSLTRVIATAAGVKEEDVASIELNSLLETHSGRSKLVYATFLHDNLCGMVVDALSEEFRDNATTAGSTPIEWIRENKPEVWEKILVMMVLTLMEEKDRSHDLFVREMALSPKQQTWNLDK